MSFAGLSKPKERADVIAYLRANTENPPPLPEPVAQAAPEPAAAAVPPATEAAAEGGEQGATDDAGKPASGAPRLREAQGSAAEPAAQGGIEPAMSIDEAFAVAAVAAERMADAVRPIVLSYFRGPVPTDAKADHTPVTAADRDAETRMREMIEEAFPATASSARSTAASASTPKTSGCSTRSTAPSRSSPASRCSAP